MNVSRFRLTFSIVLSLMASMATVESCEPILPEEVSIRDEEFDSLRERAIRGDVDATRTIWERTYFGGCGASLSEGAFWMRLGAEQGDCEMTRNLVSWLYSRGEHAESERWKKRRAQLDCRSHGMRDLLLEQQIEVVPDNQGEEMSSDADEPALPTPAPGPEEDHGRQRPRGSGSA